MLLGTLQACCLRGFDTEEVTQQHEDDFEPVSDFNFMPGALELDSRSGVSKIFSTSSSKACCTATLAFALVSTNRQPYFLARA